MILEAFAPLLQRYYRRYRQPHNEPTARPSALSLLQAWLYRHLSAPKPLSTTWAARHVHQVLRTEITLVATHPFLVFQGNSAGGQRLLESLTAYCHSYEDWEYRRWLHQLKASDFAQALEA